tara:strand:- start:239 stop:688 length:450 start_codon:yes stop_codon:yes gene_type:complete
MTNTSKFFERLGKLLPGFSGYYDRESLRENDYQLRLYIKQKIDEIIHEIERSKPSLNDDLLLEMDKVQNNLKLFSVKIANQSYGYSALFDNDNSENDMRENKLNSLIEHDEKLINLVENLTLEDKELEDLVVFEKELNELLAQRIKILR